jgi:hypothetical protein
VLTAAHCLTNIWAGQLFVYYGDNFTADFPELTQLGDTHVPPAPGQPSHWSQADSFEVNPQYDASLNAADMGVVYLDRKLPFDPLPLGRFRLDNTWNNKSATISGWGANSAPTPTTGAGGRVQRTGTTKILGGPTAADYHSDDPNPGMLNASVRNTVLKTDGHAPNANACFGDSGGPIIVNQYGQDYIAGVSYWTGLSCEDYGLYTRLDPYLPFLDQSYKKGGQETLIPFLECIAPNPSGTYTAYFGYNNKNGVHVDVPYGANNQLALDTLGFRPTTFATGTHDFVFGVDFTASQTLSYSLAPTNSPRTTINVTKNSPLCGPDKAQEVECGNYCRAIERSGCPGLTSFTQCMSDCASNIEFFADFAPECLDANTALDDCFAAVPPGTQNWTCSDPGFAPDAPSCADQTNALLSCLGF